MNKFRRKSGQALDFSVSVSEVVSNATPFDITECLHVGANWLRERSPSLRRKNEPNTEHLVLLLTARHHGPRRRSAEPRDERAPSHSITSSAIASKAGGSVTPSALAVLKLMTNSKVVACSIGRSAGFAPLRMRSTKNAARRDRSDRRAAYDKKPPASTF